LSPNSKSSDSWDQLFGSPLILIDNDEDDIEEIEPVVLTPAEQEDFLPLTRNERQAVPRHIAPIAPD
jgi:hypothetical protein